MPRRIPQNKRVRFTSVVPLINERVEARQFSRALARWKKWDLIAREGVGYIPLSGVGAEMLFHVIADRALDKPVVSFRPT